MTQREYGALSLNEKRGVLMNIIGALEVALQVNYDWDLLPHWLRRHIVHFA